MKKVLFVLAVVLLTACGSATAPETKADTTVKQDSLVDVPTDAGDTNDEGRKIK